MIELEARLHRTRRDDDDSESPASDSQDLLKDCALFLQVISSFYPQDFGFKFLIFVMILWFSMWMLQSRVEKIVSDCSDVGLLGDEDFGEFSH